MNTPADTQLARLPKWAQQHIELLEMRLAEARRTIRQFEQNEPGPIFYEKHDSARAERREVYVPSSAVCAERAGVTMEIYCAPPEDLTTPGIRVMFGRSDSVGTPAYLRLASANMFYVVAK